VPEYEIVRADDPRCAELEAAGYEIVGGSWAARLHDPDRALLESAVRRSGLVITELGAEWAEALHALETANEKDYPYTPATHRVVGDLDQIRAIWTEYRVFGALDDSLLVGATTIREHEGYGDTEFTSVLASYRGRGVGQAVKAASILAFLDAGITSFSTGGAAMNSASIGANEALGYTLTERWRSYARPPLGT
jgi:GNAT superfamily N-acetyltransferase